MDMYQKRKMRAEKKSKEDESKKFSSVTINWEITTYGKLPTKTYK